MYMMDLKAEWQKSAVRSRFFREKRQIEEMLQFLRSGSENSKVRLQAEYQKVKDNSKEARLFEAQLRDLYDSQGNLGFNFKSTQLGRQFLKIQKTRFLSLS